VGRATAGEVLTLVVAGERASRAELVAAVSDAPPGRVHVVAAADLTEAVVALRLLGRRPDLVVVDFGRPGGPGPELCRRLRRDALFASAPILGVVGAAATPTARREASAAGCAELLDGPAHLRDAVIRHLTP
jgi:CheY-like chemotaxis protein